MKATRTPEQAYLNTCLILLSDEQIKVIDSWRENAGVMTYYYPMVEFILPFEDEEAGDHFPNVEVAFAHGRVETYLCIGENGAVNQRELPYE